MGHDQQVERQRNGKLKTTSEQEKKSQTNKVRQRNTWWLIETTNNEEDETTNNEEGETTNNEEGKTTNNEEGGEYGEDLILTTVPATCVPGYRINGLPDYVVNSCPPGTEVTTESECADAGRFLGKHWLVWPGVMPHQKMALDQFGRRNLHYFGKGMVYAKRLSRTSCADCFCTAIAIPASVSVKYGMSVFFVTGNSRKYSNQYRSVCRTC